jgi:hypothetical protein
MTLEEINEQIRVLEEKKKTLIYKEQEEDIKYIESLEWTKNYNGHLVQLYSTTYGSNKYRIYLSPKHDTKPLPKLDNELLLGNAIYCYLKDSKSTMGQNHPSIDFFKAKDLIEFLTENNFNHLSYDEEWFHIMKLIYDKQNKTPEY